ncbi:unnamed protein product [Ectocarpus sp. CCAP 1310/34]|nr:unnamed protein product [Ectocarpus sp. CCAP 1310/34]
MDIGAGAGDDGVPPTSSMSASCGASLDPIDAEEAHAAKMMRIAEMNFKRLDFERKAAAL